MGTVTVNSVTINNAAGTYSHGPFSHNQTITSVDLQYIPWTNNSMYAAFNQCYQLTTITNINPNITTLVDTFYRCSVLANISTLPPSLTNMRGTFMNCVALTTAPSIPSNVINMYSTFQDCNSLIIAPTIPNGVIDMHGTFAGCRNMTTPPSIPDSVTNMYGTFGTCPSLNFAPTIPNSVQNFRYTFQGCTNLAGNIYIQSTVISDASDCFNNTTKLKNVYIPYNASLGIFTTTYNSFVAAGYVPGTTKNGATIKENPAFETYGDWWWCNYDGAIYKYLGTSTAITIPNNINGITTDLKTTFNGSNIVSLDFNKIATKNLYRVCNNCRSLTTVTNFPDNIVDLSYAFYWCANLTSVPAIPSSVLHMNYTFASSGKTSGTSISFNIPPNLIDAQGLCIGFKSLTTAPTLPESVVNLFEGFASCNSLVTAPIIPKNVKNIANAFYGCKSLTGNLYIKSNQIINAVSCFYDLQGQQLRKNVYIPFKNSDGSWSATYNSFIAAGYKTDGSFHNAYLMNYTDLYSEY